ncbi:hypothetical protein RALTA_B0759 [Cupriavidus taiwanensis LMG 19424]|uniref:Uncharacterized protein n=1 Tax=Cupriavidus taiwanensis (strain DSM 17343 / BCRC 17206 / CCUG 44338 / CIP 107171 / LMG 19424 / R1) TaxID=977880 RepID=B3R901_CUPTR|nr:hypothetical protein RALTA_B0759 [Cupriavidus taiwanensis LMG 19424]
MRHAPPGWKSSEWLDRAACCPTGNWIVAIRGGPKSRHSSYRDVSRMRDMARRQAPHQGGAARGVQSGPEYACRTASDSPPARDPLKPKCHCQPSRRTP